MVVLVRGQNIAVAQQSMAVKSKQEHAPAQTQRQFMVEGAVLEIWLK